MTGQEGVAVFNALPNNQNDHHSPDSILPQSEIYNSCQPVPLHSRLSLDTLRNQNVAYIELFCPSDQGGYIGRKTLSYHVYERAVGPVMFPIDDLFGKKLYFITPQRRTEEATDPTLATVLGSKTPIEQQDVYVRCYDSCFQLIGQFHVSMLTNRQLLHDGLSIKGSKEIHDVKQKHIDINITVPLSEDGKAKKDIQIKKDLEYKVDNHDGYYISTANSLVKLDEILPPDFLKIMPGSRDVFVNHANESGATRLIRQHDDGTWIHSISGKSVPSAAISNYFFAFTNPYAYTIDPSKNVLKFTLKHWQWNMSTWGLPAWTVWQTLSIHFSHTMVGVDGFTPDTTCWSNKGFSNPIKVSWAMKGYAASEIVPVAVHLEGKHSVAYMRISGHGEELDQSFWLVDGKPLCGMQNIEVQSGKPAKINLSAVAPMVIERGDILKPSNTLVVAFFDKSGTKLDEHCVQFPVTPFPAFSSAKLYKPDVPHHLQRVYVSEYLSRPIEDDRNYIVYHETMDENGVLLHEKYKKSYLKKGHELRNMMFIRGSGHQKTIDRFQIFHPRSFDKDGYNIHDDIVVTTHPLQGPVLSDVRLTQDGSIQMTGDVKQDDAVLVWDDTPGGGSLMFDGQPLSAYEGVRTNMDDGFKLPVKDIKKLRFSNPNASDKLRFSVFRNGSGMGPWYVNTAANMRSGQAPDMRIRSESLVFLGG